MYQPDVVTIVVVISLVVLAVSIGRRSNGG